MSLMIRVIDLFPPRGFPWRRKWQPTPVFLPGESQGRGAWWTAVYGVAQSRTRLKRLSSSSSVGFLSGSDGKESVCDSAGLGLIPGSGRSPGKGHATHSGIPA